MTASARYPGMARHRAAVAKFTKLYFKSYGEEPQIWKSDNTTFIRSKRGISFMIMGAGEVDVLISTEGKDLLVAVGKDFDWKTFGTGVVLFPFHPLSGGAAIFKSITKNDLYSEILRDISYFIVTKE